MLGGVPENGFRWGTGYAHAVSEAKLVKNPLAQPCDRGLDWPKSLFLGDYFDTKTVCVISSSSPFFEILSAKPKFSLTGLTQNVKTQGAV